MILIPIKTDNGRLKTVDVIRYIKNHFPQIKVPDIDIMNVSLSMLTLSNDNTRKCLKGTFVGTKWNSSLCVYTEGTLELIFG